MPFWGLRSPRTAGAWLHGRGNGLLDPETNLTYAVAYLANAFRVAGGDAQRR